jgi:hypothetical protein
MRTDHPLDFEQFFDYLPLIIREPDYVAAHPNGVSIEFIKLFRENDQTVLVAVRASSSGLLYARSLYEISREKLEHYTASGTTVKLDNF